MSLFKNCAFVFGCMISSQIIGSLESLKEYEKLWEYKSRDKKNQNEFASWWGNENAISRILVRLHIIHNKYTSILDAGCGFCNDYDSLKKSCPGIEYLALDISSTFVDKAKARNIPAELGRIQNIPCENSSIEVVYARHILEHLDSYQEAIKDMVRVASKEVIVVFFIAPENSPTDKCAMINIGGYITYQNRYSKPKMEAFLKTIDKVKSFSWQEVKNKDECILHIMV